MAVATLGINPSRLEFVDNSSVLLEGRSARFVSLPALKRATLADAPIADVLRVWEGCCQYFQRRPYRRWFNPLEEQVRAVGASYYEGSAAHLDLAHWATDPVWGKLPPEQRSALLKDGREFLAWQLAQPHLRLVLINGRAVLKAFVEWSGAKPEPAASFAGLRGSVAEVYRITVRAGLVVLAWTTNLQSSFGVTGEFRRTLARTVAQLV